MQKEKIIVYADEAGLTTVTNTTIQCHIGTPVRLMDGEMNHEF